jgi:hypothetical protein
MKQDEIKRLWARYTWQEDNELGQTVARNHYYSVGMLLGYPVQPPVDDASAQITPTQHSHLYDLTQELLSLKVMLSQAYKDSMAKELDDLVLDMGTYINNLKSSGSAKLAVLSKYTGIPLEVDMFTGRVYQTHSTPYSIKSIG